MALEALASLSLASSIVQFVEFASRLISKGNKYYKSIDGTLEEHSRLKDISKSLHHLSLSLEKSAGPFDTVRNLSPDEQALNRVAIECRAIATEFSNIIDKLKLSDPRTRWKSFRQSVKSHWSKNEIQDMLQRLRLLREDLAIHLLVVVK